MSLTIRNLTSVGLDLKLTERFHKPKAEGEGGFANITRNITSFVTNSTDPSPAEVAHDAQCFEHHDENLHLDAFSTHSLQIRAPGTEEILRLTFEVDGQRYRIDVPQRSEHSVTMTPLGENKHDFTVIYSRENTHLALFRTSHLESWMRGLKDETPLTGLSIPGTHNSPTCHRALPSVRCQAVTPREQLENGVRFFDLRVQPEKPEDPNHDGLILVHSVFPISMTGTKYFRDLVKEIEDFLAKNPSETLVMSVKREGTGNATDEQLGHILRNHYAGDVRKWFTAPHIPTIGEARGKIVLIRRFHLDDQLRKEWDGKGWCINAEAWADNTPHALTPDKNLCVQDFYEVLETENIEKKIQYSVEQLGRAAATMTPLPGMQAQGEQQKQPLFINFLSASNFWKAGCWPEKIAARVNPAVIDYLCRKHNEPEAGKQIGDGTTGIVVCDWVGNGGNWDVVSR